MTNLRHVGITISSLERSLEFYRDALGFKVFKMMDESGECIDNFSSIKGILVTTVKMKDSNDNMVELLCYKSHPGAENFSNMITDVGCSHIALTVEDLDSLYHKLMKEYNIKFNYPVQVSPDGKVKVAFCRDPDGTLIEMVEEL